MKYDDPFEASCDCARVNVEPTTSPTPSFALRLWLAATEKLDAGGLPGMMMWAALIGFLGAFATALFSMAIRSLLWAFTGFWGIPEDAASHISIELRPFIPAVGGLIAGLILVVGRRVLGDEEEHGEYMEAIVIGSGRISVRDTLVRSLSSLLSIGSGASIGREGPMVQLTSMVGSVVGSLTKLPAPRKRLLIACGAAAGLTAAYDAPVAGALFVAEIVLGSIATESFGPLLVAAVVANLTTQQFFGVSPLYALPGFATISPLQSSWYVVLGILCGAASPPFLWLLESGRGTFQRMHLPLPLALCLGGLVVGLLSMSAPEVWGNGYGIVTAILVGKYLGLSLLIILVLKVFATTASVGSGAIGGIFTPTLFVGAALGSVIGQAVNHFIPELVPYPTATAVIGMGAFLAAGTRAPLMSILMIFEMTASDQIILPLMLACVPAYVTARAIRRESMYSKSLRVEAQREDRAEEIRRMRVRDLTRSDVPTVNLSDSLNAVAQAFATHRFQYLYVLDQGLYCGVISLHDLRPLIENPEVNHEGAASGLVLTDFQTLNPEATIEQALLSFARHRGERLPVVDKDRKLIGAAWKTDVMLALHETLAHTSSTDRPPPGEKS